MSSSCNTTRPARAAWPARSPASRQPARAATRFRRPTAHAVAPAWRSARTSGRPRVGAALARAARPRHRQRVDCDRRRRPPPSIPPRRGVMIPRRRSDGRAARGRLARRTTAAPSAGVDLARRASRPRERAAWRSGARGAGPQSTSRSSSRPRSRCMPSRSRTASGGPRSACSSPRSRRPSPISVRLDCQPWPSPTRTRATTTWTRGRPATPGCPGVTTDCRRFSRQAQIRHIPGPHSRILSNTPETTRSSSYQGLRGRWRDPDSNRGHHDFQSYGHGHPERRNPWKTSGFGAARARRRYRVFCRFFSRDSGDDWPPIPFLNPSLLRRCARSASSTSARIRPGASGAIPLNRRPEIAPSIGRPNSAALAVHAPKEGRGGSAEGDPRSVRVHGRGSRRRSVPPQAQPARAAS